MKHTYTRSCRHIGPHADSAAHWMLIGEYASPIDGSPIVAMANLASTNSKTSGRGRIPTVGIYIISATTDPRTLSNQADDGAICGACVQRRSTGGGCYVTIGRGPLAAFNRYKRGEYRPFELTAFVGKFVRFGEYGDPAFIPLDDVAQIASVAAGHTGYTHQWTYRDRGYARYFMASVESDRAAENATKRGYRYFKVSATGELRPREFSCPASEEQGHRLVCGDCVACDGGARGIGRANPVIIVHGALSKRAALVA